MALAAFLVCGLAGLVLLWLTEDRLDGAVATDRSGLFETATGVVSLSVGRAVAHGLPPARLPGIGDYLDALRGRLPGVTRIDLRIGDEHFVSGVAGAGDAVSAHRLALVETSAELSFHYPPHALGAARGRLLLRILGAATLAAALSALGFGLFTGRAMRRAEARLSNRLSALEQGDFTHAAPAAGQLPQDRALAALEARLEPLNLRHALLLHHAEGLRAIDHDGSLTAQVDAVMAGLPKDWRFSAPSGTRRE